MKTLTKIILLFLLLLAFKGKSQKLKTENIFIVTMDGLRWQELYGGADSSLIDDKKYVHNPKDLKNRFWKDDMQNRRETLMPFFWNTLAHEGQLYGNRKHNNKVNCTNNMWFSYPGYSEILCGFADNKRIKSNAKIPNPNTTVLEFFNRGAYKGKVAAFGSWDVFPYIINEKRSGIPVNAGFEPYVGDDITEREQFLNVLQKEIRSPWGGVRLDVFTHHYALEYIKKNKPKVVYIAYGETDDFAHDGRYDEYLKSAHQTDQYIKGLWEYIQSEEEYKDKTTMIITTDHGRGTVPKDTWRSHGIKIHGGGEIWFAAIGPDTEALGEIRTEGQYYQNQVAKTAAAFLGIVYKNDRKIGEVVKEMFNKNLIVEN